MARNDERISFHGRISDERLKHFYEQSNFLVIPSVWYETFGLVILESFSHGTPVIGSQIGAIPELIKDGYNGYLFEPKDDEKLKNIICNLSSTNVHKMQKNAYATAQEHNIRTYVQKLEIIYASVK